MSAISAGLKGNISSVVTLFAGLFFLICIPSQIADFGTDGLSGVSARTMPYLIASAIVIFSLFSILTSIWENRSSAQQDASNTPQGHTRYGAVFLAFVSIALWIVLLPIIGFNIATALLIAVIMRIIGKCVWWQVIVLSFALSVPVNALLAIVLKVYLPSGSLFE